MAQGIFSGWRGTVLAAVVGLVVVGGGLGAAVLLSRGDDGLEAAAFDEPGAVPLPGQLECVAAGGPVPVSADDAGPVTALVPLRDGSAVVAAGGLRRGTPAEGLAAWGEPVLAGDVRALSPDPLDRHVFAAGPAGVAAVDLETGAVTSTQPLPAGTPAVTGVAATTRRVYVTTEDGTVLEARWAYERLEPFAPADLRDEVPPASALLAAPNGESLLLVTGGPLVRLGTDTLRAQDVPVAPSVAAASMSQGAGGLVYLVEGSTLRVMILNERWVTGRLSTPVDGWQQAGGDVAALPDGLLVADPSGALSFSPLPTCNREELTRLDETGG